MSSDCTTSSPDVRDKNECSSQHLPRCLFLGSHEDCLGELTLDTSTLKEIWGDESVALALASMLKAVLEGRVSFEKPKEDENEATDKKTEETPPNEETEARLALLEVFECFSAGQVPGPRTIHVLDIDSLLARQRELSEARKAHSSDENHDSSSSTESLQPSEPMSAEEEMLSVLLNLVYVIRKKHKLPSPLEISSSPSSSSTPSGEGESASDDNSLTFGIVDSDVSSRDKSDFDKEWLLVCRETKKHKASENGIYPIQSIYSFFLVLNSDDFSQPSSQSPSSDGSDDVDDVSNGDSTDGNGDNSNDDDVGEEDDETVSVTPESDEPKGSPDKNETSPQDVSKPSLFVSVKKHEESAWSVLAALHEEGFEIKDDEDEGSAGKSHTQVPDVTVIVDPLRIISEYIRYLQGEQAPPRDDQRKRRRVQVHESTVARPSCKIRILTPIDEDEEGHSVSPAGSHQTKEEYLQAEMVREQDELRKLLEQKLRELQQSIASQEAEEEEAREKSSTSESCTSSSVPQ